LILAMAGNAVGLGNFLRFPRQAAANGGGSFMITYFVALLLLGIPLMWIEWGVGRHGGHYRKGHIPGMLAALWKHPAAKYLGVVGMVIPLTVMIYYTYIESWTLAFSFFSLFKDYWGHTTREGMIGYLTSFQGFGSAREHAAMTPYLFFTVTLLVNIWVLSKGVSGGIEKLAKIGMPLLFLFAIVLAVVVLLQPAHLGSPAQGLEFIYNPDFSRVDEASVWLASAGQIFFTLSVGMGSLQAYASYLSRKDDIALNGIATAATNETAEVVLGGSIAIPAAVTFFGVAGAMAIAQSGSFNRADHAGGVPAATARQRTWLHVVLPAVLRRHYVFGCDAHSHHGVLPRGVRHHARTRVLDAGRRLLRVRAHAHHLAAARLPGRMGLLGGYLRAGRAGHHRGHHLRLDLQAREHVA
jgi:SNF family Na+-dependent transporter